MKLFRLIKKSLDLNLRKLILFLAVFSVSTLFIISLIVSYQIVKNQLINNSLVLNYEYANKIATSTDNHFKNILIELEYSAKNLGKSFDDDKTRELEVQRLKMQSNYYNSVVIGDPQGRLINYSPNILNIDKNKVQNTLGIENSLKNKKTYISTPYLSVKKNMIIFNSQPIYDSRKNYKGFIGSTIYLKERNIINQLLTTADSYRKSYMYVIDKNGQIIFHPDHERIGEIVKNNNGLDYIKERKNGKIRLINSRGVDNLAGFAHIKTTDWIIVSQQPTMELLKQATSIIYKVSAGIFIFYLLIFYIVWKCSFFIASPLHKLANIAGSLHRPEVRDEIRNIYPWYYEIVKFKHSLLLSIKNFSIKINEMDRSVNTDPLTGLMNRRGMNFFIANQMTKKEKFSILLIDIDFFKRINDTYGHDQGDLILKYLAEIMQKSFRKNDACCRYGGEEFIIVIPNTSQQSIYESAERFRRELETQSLPNVGSITVSIGIASWPESSDDILEVFKIADKHLYEAKNSGRNCVKF
ncbi:sensor domain-containing diguanylate cyclase [Acinetobacter sp. TSRC1-2]|uniref:sensor domain-containing diguanylate cyclase n=1 Tax=unclassified Acinetobacter TaxID=196816 RepID=UPI003CF76D65